MRRAPIHLFSLALLAAVIAATVATSLARAGCTGCTGGCEKCVPACSGTWDEKKSTKPVYSMTCEYACVRGRDAWHAPPPECRCHPPCGVVIVKKKFFKVDGPEKVERVPKYEVKMVPAEPCDTCNHGRSEGRPCWWNPLAALHRCTSWW
jgi:hypothetical protein